MNKLNLAGDHDFGRAVRPGLSYVDSVPRKSYYEMLQAYMKHLEVIISVPKYYESITLKVPLTFFLLQPTDSGESESQEELVY